MPAGYVNQHVLCFSASAAAEAHTRPGSILAKAVPCHSSSYFPLRPPLLCAWACAIAITPRACGAALVENRPSKDLEAPWADRVEQAPRLGPDRTILRTRDIGARDLNYHLQLTLLSLFHFPPPIAPRRGALQSIWPARRMSTAP